MLNRKRGHCMKLAGLFAAMAILFVLNLAGCSKEEDRSNKVNTTPATKTEVVAPTTNPPVAAVQGKGTIAGRVIFTGNFTPGKLSIGKDREVCGDAKQDPSLLVGADGGLQNAVIQINGLRQGKISANAAELDQKNCQYAPHVLVVPTGAKVTIKNNDGILHNIHTESKANTPFNRAQPKYLKELNETFSKPEIIAVRCDVHGWMSGWIVVTDNVFFAVSGADGSFKLTDVPAGKYMLEAWHEKFGKTTHTVDVKPGETASMTFEFQDKK
jgi:plastocyanin